MTKNKLALLFASLFLITTSFFIKINYLNPIVEKSKVIDTVRPKSLTNYLE